MKKCRRRLKKASIPTQYLAKSARQRMPLQQQNKLMKELLKLLPIMGFFCVMVFSVGCAGGEEAIDDTPPPADEEYDESSGEPPAGEGEDGE